MKKLRMIWAIASMAAVTTLYAQDTLQKPANTEPVMEFVEQTPEFPGGQQALYQFISDNVKYPEEAIKKNIEGRVIVQFIVDKAGKVINAKVISSPDSSLSAEALRVVNSMPNFTPGKNNGKPVNVMYRLPIVFKLEDSKSKSSSQDNNKSKSKKKKKKKAGEE